MEPEKTPDSEPTVTPEVSAPVENPTPVVEAPVETPAPVETSAPVEAAPVVEAPQPALTATTADPGHVWGIVSLILSLLGISLIGLIVGFVGLNKSKKVGKKNGLALAGIIIGALGVIASIFIIFAISTGALVLMSANS